MGQIYRFGVFRFDAARLELRRDGEALRLQRQPAQVLALLLTNAGRLVTRDELRQAIWGNDRFVEFDRGLNVCIAQIRSALRDDAVTPRYVSTIPKQGYEFICPTERELPEATQATSEEQTHASRTTTGLARPTAIAVTIILVIAAATLVFIRSRGALAKRLTIAVAHFDNETGNPSLTQFSDSLTDNVVEQLTLTGKGSFAVVGNAAILRKSRDQRDLRAIGESLTADYVILGQVQRDAVHVRVLGHLIRLPDQTHVSVARFDNVSELSLAKGTEIAARMTERFADHLRRTQSRHAGPGQAAIFFMKVAPERLTARVK